jgi:uncharacterized protein YprB with RNaseH-like and TPR domain
MTVRNEEWVNRFRILIVRFTDHTWDTGVIQEVVDIILDECYDQLDDNKFNESTHVFVTLTGNIRANMIHRPLGKSFQMRLMSYQGLYDLIQEIENWAQTFIGRQFDYIAFIDEIEIKFVPEPAGGCDSREHIINIDTDVLGITRKTKNNNCFFSCLVKIFGKMTPLECDLWRRRHNIEPEAMIPLSIAQDYARVYFNREWHGSQGPQIILKDSHYSIYKCDLEKHRCNRCHKSYKTKHSCIYDLHPTCPDCLEAHDDSVSCYIDRLEFVQRKRQKTKKTRRVKSLPSNGDPYIVLHYDIETYVNEKGVHTPYVVGFCWDVDETFEYFVGDNCMIKLVVEIVRKLSSLDNDKEDIIVNAFNGSRFDHFFLLKAFLSQEYPPTKFALSNGAIVVCQFLNRINFWDVSRHLQGSLKKNLEIFNCKVQKGDFDHEKASRWEVMSDHLKSECIKYLEGDVMGLNELFDVIHLEILKEYSLEVVRFISTSQLTFTIWRKRTFSNKRCELVYLPNLAQERFFRSAIYGGRCYKSKNSFVSEQYSDICDGKIDFNNIDDYVVDMDVVSLYPAAMQREFPVGECQTVDARILLELDDYLRLNNELKYIGIYKIRFRCNTELCHAILPRRTDEGLKWTLHDGEGTYSSTDINNALKFGYKIEILEGYFWYKSSPILKHYVNYLFEKKKVEGSINKGSAKYVLLKLFLNALYGKMIQRPIYDVNKWCSSLDDFHGFVKECSVHEMTYVEDQIFVAGYKNDIKEIEKNITKPSHIGVFILAYSRDIMLNYFVKSNPYFMSGLVDDKIRNDIFYTDTDSMQVHVRNKLPFGTGLGELDDDLGGGKIIRAFWIAPKLYYLEYIVLDKHDGTMKKFFHFRGKGVQTSNLNEQMFEWMNDGKAVLTTRDFQMKRITTKRNSTQFNFDCFSIVHLPWFKTGRFLNENPWKGRLFVDENSSLPQGFKT